MLRAPGESNRYATLPTLATPPRDDEKIRSATLIREYEGQTWPNGSAVAIVVGRVTSRWPCRGRS